MAHPNISSSTSPSETITTAFLLSNLHCPSCVVAAKDAIQSAHTVLWISPNVITSVVTVEHNDTITVEQLKSTLEGAGFDVCGISAPTTDAGGQSAIATSSAQYDGILDNISNPTSVLSQWIAPVNDSTGNSLSRDHRARIHLQTCKKCRSSETYGSDENTYGDKKPLHGFSDPKEVERRESVPAATPYAGIRRATLSIGGITCAVCVNTITDEVSKLDWVSNITVSLVTNSATVDFIDENNLDNLLGTIEDLGYDATVDTLVNLDDQKPNSNKRTVEIRLDGTYCVQCPTRVAKSLAGFRRQVESATQLTGPQSIIKVTYVPEAPDFTIRQILAAIEAGDPALTASIYHSPTLEERSKQIMRNHQRQLIYRVVLTGIIAIPTFIIGVVYMSLIRGSNASKQYLMAPWISGISRTQIALFALATPVYFLAADVFHTRAIKEIKTLWRRGSQTPVLRRFYKFGSMNTLLSLGTTIAYASSVAQLIAAGVNRPKSLSNTNFYFDSVIFLTLFLLIGRLIESFSKAHTGNAIEMLGKLRPTTAVLVERLGTEKEEDRVIPAELLDFGDTIRIPYGTSPPADGVVVQGETNFDESGLTGESRPVKKKSGDEVFAGAVNIGAPILLQVTGTGGKSMLDEIFRVVRDGQAKRAPVERIADVMTTFFVPVINVIAILTWVIWMGLGLSGRIPPDWLDVTSGGWVAWSLQFAIAVFVVACPCGLALAAPTAIFVGVGLAARHGILAKSGGEAFEKASKVDCVVFDKTGTLTMGGEPAITDFETYPDSVNFDEDCKNSLFSSIKAVEGHSSHSIAKAIVSFCSRTTTSIAKIENVEEVPGKGMKATCIMPNYMSAYEIIVGSEALMADYSVEISAKVAAMLQKWKSEAKSIALAATKPIVGTTALSDSSSPTYTLAAMFSISDPIRPEAPAVIKALHDRGTAVWLLSGDNPATAAAVALQLGINPDNVIAGVLPVQKAEKITYLQSSLKSRINASSESTTRRATVAMVGDGINDSPALTTADVGIAIGSGSDIAISCADFVLLNSDLNCLVNVLDLSRAVLRRIKFNFGWALVYNCIAIPLAAGCLYPLVSNGSHIRLDPVWASLAMALSSISVVTSSLALRSRLPGIGFRVKKVQ
ncbi:Hypothetical protein R9X50_00144200 [Acrodontium crateriforme]|uniref:Uncharacterized protein n=1 Tax=Acrodontium crateriforme TaxID=150365 RepID=A0AAQ3R871_9PEZI|nr:Hypothetical protein R9X50_00144200 [Acrodontium crateriforme]